MVDAIRSGGAAPPPAGWHVAIREPLDVFLARWAVQRVAAPIGFRKQDLGELAIVVSELTTNILKYGRRGEISLGRLDDPQHGAGIEIVAEDEGPPLADLESALRDGWGDRGPIDPAHLRRGGIGAGLGAIRRLTDTFEYRPGGARKSFRVTRYLRRPKPQGV